MNSSNIDELKNLLTQYLEYIDRMSHEQNLHQMAILKNGYRCFFIEGNKQEFNAKLRKELSDNPLVEIIQTYRCPYHNWELVGEIRGNLIDNDIIHKYDNKYFTISPKYTESEFLSHMSVFYGKSLQYIKEQTLIDNTTSDIMPVVSTRQPTNIDV